MASLVVRGLTEEVHRALKSRAASNGRSTEAEVRVILASAVEAEMSFALGSEMAAVGKQIDGVDIDIDRDTAPHQPIDFS